jgi:hypothetical protein
MTARAVELWDALIEATNPKMYIFGVKTVPPGHQHPDTAGGVAGHK